MSFSLQLLHIYERTLPRQFQTLLLRPLPHRRQVETEFSVASEVPSEVARGEAFALAVLRVEKGDLEDAFVVVADAAAVVTVVGATCTSAVADGFASAVVVGFATVAFDDVVAVATVDYYYVDASVVVAVVVVANGT